MYAVIKAGGRQYQVKTGDNLTLNKIEGEPGKKIEFSDVLAIGGEKAKIGTPFVAGAKVEATIKAHQKGEKVTVFKYKRRKNYKVNHGHRQSETVIEINNIKG